MSVLLEDCDTRKGLPFEEFQARAAAGADVSEFRLINVEYADCCGTVTAAEDRGFTAAYNFGSRAAAALRWRAAIATGVDFVATDQYADFAALRR